MKRIFVAAVLLVFAGTLSLSAGETLLDSNSGLKLYLTKVEYYRESPPIGHDINMTFRIDNSTSKPVKLKEVTIWTYNQNTQQSSGRSAFWGMTIPANGSATTTKKWTFRQAKPDDIRKVTWDFDK